MPEDRIEKQVVLKAPLARVWRAISDSQQFGAWFRIDFEGEFREGAQVRGRITFPVSRGSDPAPEYQHLTADFFIERIRAPHYLSYRWHPYAIDPTVDYSHEPMTLVEFQLTEVPEGTQLTITESGFERLPAGRKPEAFRMNEGGWTAQLENVEQYVARR
jgi:uncharacterized protein YndB with AHSA1/START domain